MSGYLNTSTSFILYKQMFNSEYFVDKSGIISMINKRIQTNVIKLVAIFLWLDSIAGV